MSGFNQLGPEYPNARPRIGEVEVLAVAGQTSPEPKSMKNRANNGLGLIWLGALHTLYCLLFAPVNGLELSLILPEPHFSNDSRLAVLLGYSLYGLPLILLGLCLHSLEQNPVSFHLGLRLAIAFGLALLCSLAVIAQPHSLFWLGLLLAGRIAWHSKAIEVR